MSPAGRPPKPIEQKRRMGNPGKRKLPDPSNALVVEGRSDVPVAPNTLRTDGQIIWPLVWQSAPWLHPDLDRIRLTTACHLADDIAAYRSDINAMGSLLDEPIVTPTGQVVGTRSVPNPLVKMLRDAEKQLANELSSLGLNPTSRSRLGLELAKKKSILQSLEAPLEIVEADAIEIIPD